MIVFAFVYLIHDCINSYKKNRYDFFAVKNLFFFGYHKTDLIFYKSKNHFF